MRQNMWKVSTGVLALALGASLMSGRTGVQADQPNMREAKEHLVKARECLERATEDKGGHRVNALRLTREAIDQVEAGIKFDRKN